eukprot:gene10474-14075_t
MIKATSATSSLIKNNLVAKNLQIKCILSDMDGTLINSKIHRVSDRSIAAIKLAQINGIKFFPATGRTRKSMAAASGQTFIDFLTPYKSSYQQLSGVYSQGLQVYVDNDKLLYERFLGNAIISKVEDFCLEHQLSLIAYCNDDIYCKSQDLQTNKITVYSEPIPTIYSPGLDKLDSNLGIRVNKLIILQSESRLVQIRPKVEQLIKNEASLTSAVPGMLEVLPYGASKGDGVERLLKYYDISPQETMAFGDGENDIEMLQLVGTGIAMSNAKLSLKNISNHVTSSNDEDGVALLLEELYSTD